MTGLTAIFFAYISLIAWVLAVIGGSAFLVFKGIDADAAKNLRLHLHSFTATYFFEGALCWLLTYGFDKLNTVERGGKRTLIIAGGFLLGLLSIVLGLSKLFGG